MLFCGIHNPLYILPGTDVSRVDADLICSGLNCSNRHSPVKMNVGNKRHVCFLPDAGENLQGLLVRDGQTDNLTSRLLKLSDLFQDSLFISGIHIAHGLYNHWCAASKRDIAHHNLFSAAHRNPLFCV